MMMIPVVKPVVDVTLISVSSSSTLAVSVVDTVGVYAPPAPIFDTLASPYNPPI